MRRALCLTIIPGFVLAFTLRVNAQQPTDEPPQANPARPTVATPATLTPVGYLQFENGVLYAEDSQEFSSLVVINQVTKLTVHPRVQFLVASAPLVHSGLGTDKEVHAGDVLVGTQVVLARSEEHTSELQSLRHLVCRLL